MFNIVSTILFFAFALALLASVAVYSLPPYIFSDLLPLPTLSVSTMAFAVLALLFAALTASYASQACHRTARNARNPAKEGRIMGKVVICLVLTLVFSFLSVQSFLSNDYARLQRWLAYYQEYKAFEEAVKRGNASKAELFERLKTMYPGQVSELEAHLKEKYGDLTDTRQRIRIAPCPTR